MLEGHITGCPYGLKICGGRVEQDPAFTIELPQTTVADSYTLVVGKVHLIATCGISFKIGPCGEDKD